MTEIVQLLGYRDVPLDEIRQQLGPLIDQYGQQAISDAAEEILEIVEVTHKVARLKEEVRPIARQILGGPPKPAVTSVPDVFETSAPVPSPSPAVPNDPPHQPMSSQPPNSTPNQSPPTSTDEERYLAAYEARKEPLYCCDQPKLKWSGQIDDLSVACESCGYVLFARDELMPDGEPPGIILAGDESSHADR